jgi:hypothetical protein
MKSMRFMLALILVGFSSLALAQSDAQKSFDKMKTLAGSWEGQVTSNPPNPEIENKHVKATLRVTSMGNTLVHEMTGEGRPDDPMTMFVVEGDRLLLTHYCDANNRPRMVGRASADGKTVEYDFLDVTGDLKYGHMQHAVFTFIDADHHSEEWTFAGPGGEAMRARMDLQRTK